MKINELGLSDFDVRVYNKLVQSKGRIGKDKLFLGDKWLASEVNFIKCSGQELKDALKNLVNVNLITPQTRGKLYNEYFTINDLDNAQSPMPFDDDFMVEVNAVGVEEEIAKLDSACRQLFKNCNSFKQYMEDTFEWTGSFNFNKNDRDNLSKLSGVSVYRMTEIMKNLAMEINPINQPVEVKTEIVNGIDVNELIKYAKEGVKKMNKSLDYEWDLERHVIKWWYDKEMTDIRELMAVDILGDYMRDNLLLDENAEVDTTKAMELMGMIYNHYHPERIIMRIACSDESENEVF